MLCDTNQKMVSDDITFDILAEKLTNNARANYFGERLSLYQEAVKLAPDNFQMFSKHTQNEIQDIKNLNRAIYHKIQNEISLLKIIAYQIVADDQSEKVFSDIIRSIEDTSEEITRHRNEEKAKIDQIPANDYEKIIGTISRTAHDISDIVNNELAVIKQYALRALKKKENAPVHKIRKLLNQIEFAESAMNDLKSVNEGIKIHYRPFKIKELFENWKDIPKLRNAKILFDIRNGESVFVGDEQKIKSFLSELLENSLKNNSDKPDMEIRISSQDVNGLPPHVFGWLNESQRRVTGEKRYLSILFNDNGRGISQDKKEWIFLPLNTTAEDSSGLGLFIIRRTLAEMKGYIFETGNNGANFEIYIPYGEEE